MIDYEEFTPEEVDEQNKRLIQDLRTLYSTGAEDTRSLASMRERLLKNSSITTQQDLDAIPQQPVMLPTPRARSSNMNLRHIRHRLSEGKKWAQRFSALVAVLFVTLLVGSLVIVLSHAHQSTTGIGTGNQAIRSIHMIDANIGWSTTSGYAPHYRSVLRTTDGGIHWKDVSPSNVDGVFIDQPVNGPADGWFSADFLDRDTAWIAVTPDKADSRLFDPVATSQIFRTTDAGRTWQKTTIQTNGNLVGRITFSDSLDGWLLTEFQASIPSGNVTSQVLKPADLYRTIDGGKSWIKLQKAHSFFIDINSVTGMTFLNSTTGWLIGWSGNTSSLYVTHDGGETWELQILGVPVGIKFVVSPFDAPKFFTANDGILPATFFTGTTQYLVFYVTHDGGKTLIPTTPVPAISSWAFIDTKHGWVFDTSTTSNVTNLYRTDDGGQHWVKTFSTRSFFSVSSLDFVSNNIGWAVAFDGQSRNPILLKTTDGGYTWTQINFTIS